MVTKPLSAVWLSLLWSPWLPAIAILAVDIKNIATIVFNAVIIVCI
ncbi:hypothetical protein IMCC1989_2223 [gamma proteobacterium IMCC1989]|nr:hypothetical protein IMCC1989_2223 [gamma proteobacterium IMCC1989]